MSNFCSGITAHGGVYKTDNVVQKPDNILAIFEVKMSVVWNWELLRSNAKFKLKCLGDFKTHQGNPGLLRSDCFL